MRISTWQAPYSNHFQRARVLITGGAGFIGSHLAQTLVTLGAEVIVLDDLSGGSVENLQDIGPVRFVQGSINDAQTLALGSSTVAGMSFIRPRWDPCRAALQSPRAIPK